MKYLPDCEAKVKYLTAWRKSFFTPSPSESNKKSLWKTYLYLKKHALPTEN